MTALRHSDGGIVNDEAQVAELAKSYFESLGKGSWEDSAEDEIIGSSDRTTAELDEVRRQC